MKRLVVIVSVLAGIAVGVRFVTVPRAHATAFFDGTTGYYFIDAFASTMHRVTTSNFLDVATQAITTDTGQTRSSSGFIGASAIDSTSATVYAVLGLNAGGGNLAGRYLTTIDLSTGVAHVIGKLTRNFSAIAFDAAGTLYGMTGDQASTPGPDPSTLFSINKTTAAITLIQSYSNTANGEGLTYNPNTGRLYRMNGKNIFSIDPVDGTSTSVCSGAAGLSAFAPYTTALFYDSSANKYYAANFGYVYEIDLGTCTILNGPYITTGSASVKNIFLYATVSFSSTTPADNDVNVPENQDLVMHLNEAVTRGTGNITVHKSSDDSVLETIPVTSSNVTGWGTTTITATPTVLLPFDTEVYVNIDNTAFVGTDPWPGITSTTAWSFTTRPSGTSVSFDEPFTSMVHIDTGATTASVSLATNGVTIPAVWTGIATGPSSGADTVSTLSDFGISRRIQMAVTPAGVPIILYTYANDIYVKKWNGSAWTQMDGSAGNGLISSGSSGAAPRLILTAAGNPIVVWSDSAATRDIMVTKWNGSAWTQMDGSTPGPGAVAVTSGISQQPQIALTAAGNPIVVWSDLTNSNPFGDIVISEWNGSAWTKMDGTTPGYSYAGVTFNDVSLNPQIVITPTDVPIVTWSDGSVVGKVLVTEFVGGASKSMDGSTPGYDTIASGVGSGNHPMIALDTDNNPIITWDTTLGFLAVSSIYISKWNGSAWASMNGSPGNDSISTGTNTSYPQIAVAAANTPIVTWFDYLGAPSPTAARIYVSKWNGSAWAKMDGTTSPGYDVVSDPAGFGTYPQMVLTGAGDPIVVWPDSNTSALLVTKWNGSAWTQMDGSTLGPGKASSNKGTSINAAGIALLPSDVPVVGWQNTPGTFAARYFAPDSADVLSGKVNGLSTDIAVATLTATDTTPGASSIDYFMSDDGGSTWEAVTSGVEHVFSAPGDDLRWKAVLNKGSSPTLSGIALDYAIPSPTATPIPTPTPSVSGGHSPTGTLVVKKVIIGDHAGIDVDDFSYTVDNEPDRFDETGSKTYTRPTGMLRIQEHPFSGYTTTYGGDCDASGYITVAHDATRTCIITNTAVPTPTPAPGSAPVPTPSISPEPWEVTPGGTLEGTNLREGDTVSAVGSNDPDVYIVNTAGYKRLFLNPVIFSFYGHLGGFSKVKTITPQVRDSFPTSGLFRNCETNDQAVYGVETTGEDTGILHHIALTGDQAVSQDPDFFKKVFCINTKEFDWYAKGSDYTSLSQVPRYRR